jgi:hypothetical protein
LKEKQTIQALKLIVKEYKGHFGETIGELSEWAFSDDLFENNKELNSISLAVSPEPVQKRKYSKKIINHLIEKGYIQHKADRYYLTKSGFIEGSQGIFGKSLVFLNNNPGLAVVISSIALLISILALYVSYAKP